MTEINFRYRKDFYSTDETMITISKYDRMKELVAKKFAIMKEHDEKLRIAEDELNTEINDHVHEHIISFDCPPYGYGSICTICGHTKF